MTEKSPWAAAVLSFFIPGLGHWYANGDWVKGVHWFLGCLLINICTFCMALPVTSLLAGHNAYRILEPAGDKRVRFAERAPFVFLFAFVAAAITIAITLM